MNGLLADLEEEVADLASVIVISHNFDGSYHLTYCGSEPEVLGLCELAKIAIIREIEEREDI